MAHDSWSSHSSPPRSCRSASLRASPPMRPGGAPHHGQRLAQVRRRAVGVAEARGQRRLAREERLRQRRAVLLAVRQQRCAVAEVQFGEPLERGGHVGHGDALDVGARVAGDDAHVVDGGMVLDGRLRLRAHRLIGLQHGVGGVALALAVHARGGDVHALVADALRDMGQHALLVALPHDDARALAGDAHVDVVDLADDGRAAADALAAHIHRVARGVHDADVDGVGMVVLRVGQRDEREREPRLARKVEGVADAQVVGGQPQHAGHEGLVGAVAGERVRERPQQPELHRLRLGQAQPARHVGDAQRARRVRARRAHHDGADDVGEAECFHGRSSLCRFRWSCARSGLDRARLWYHGRVRPSRAGAFWLFRDICARNG